MVVKNRALVIWLSAVAGVQAFTASAGLADVVSDRWLALLTAVTAALSAGTAAFVAGVGRELPPGHAARSEPISGPESSDVPGSTRHATWPPVDTTDH